MADNNFFLLFYEINFCAKLLTFIITQVGGGQSRN